MTDLLAVTDKIFFDGTDLDKAKTTRLVTDGLKDAYPGELYLQHTETETLARREGKLDTATASKTAGFGFRRVDEEAIGYSYTNEMTHAALERAIGAANSIARSGGQGTICVDRPGLIVPPPLYTGENPLGTTTLGDRLRFLEDVDSWVREFSPKEVLDVSVSLASSWSAVSIIQHDGTPAADIRPLVRLNIGWTIKDGGKKETGGIGMGGRWELSRLFNPAVWQAAVKEEMETTVNMLTSGPAPAGEMPVVLGPGWLIGVLIHEAVGHGLEGDFNRKGTSVYSGKMGQRVAAPGVTVIEQGDLPGLRGSLTIDDEGTPTQRNVLIEDGILKGYLHDRQNARLMGMKPTGNGRRESYAHVIMPRMTNTQLANGSFNPAALVSEAGNGLLVLKLGGGQVDITSGRYVFSVAAARVIRDGQAAEYVKGATLIGSGFETLNQVRAVGNDGALDPGVGTCGKDGQWVPVGAGGPSVLIGGLTVGGRGGPR